jgi:hypothetical protein
MGRKTSIDWNCWMLRMFLVILMLSTAALAQNAAVPSPDERLRDVGQLLERGSTGEAERLLRQLVPKPEEEPSDGGGIFSTYRIRMFVAALFVAHELFPPSPFPRRSVASPQSPRPHPYTAASTSVSAKPAP